MTVVPEIPEGTVNTAVKSDESASTPIVDGDGGTDWICGQCDAVVLAGTDRPLPQQWVYECPVCGALNVDPSWVT